MLPPTYYETTLDDIAALYERLDGAIIRSLAERIVKTLTVTETTRWEIEILQSAGLLYEDIISEIAAVSGQSEKLLTEIFKNAGVESVKFDNRIYEAAGLEPLPIRQSPEMTQILKAGIAKTGGALTNLTMTTALTSQQAYIRACTDAYMQVSSGAFDYTRAISGAVRSAVSEGVRVRYPSGHTDHLDVAIRRSTLTGVSQTAAKISMQNAAAMGCDLMEITAHAGARPSHAAWQGKLVSLSGRKGYLSLKDIGFGDVRGFKGPNCRHDWFPFFEGIDERVYSDARLVELRNDGLYELQQEQRSMERKIRETKRKLAGYDAAIKAADPATADALRQDFNKHSAKLKRREAAMREFCQQHGLRVDKSRTQVYYGTHGGKATAGFGRSTAQKAVWADRKHKNT